MATTTNWGWTTPDDTALVANGASAMRTLGSAIDTSLGTRVGVSATRAAVQAVATGTNVAVSWTATTYNSPSFITVTNTPLTVPANSAGIYGITFLLSWASDPGTSSSCWIDLNDAGVRWATWTEAGSSARWNPVAGRFVMGVSAVLPLAVGDSATFYARQASGASINIVAEAHMYRIWK